jgi:hypothetical protein
MLWEWQRCLGRWRVSVESDDVGITGRVLWGKLAMSVVTAIPGTAASENVMAVAMRLAAITGEPLRVLCSMPGSTRSGWSGETLEAITLGTGLPIVQTMTVRAPHRALIAQARSSDCSLVVTVAAHWAEVGARWRVRHLLGWSPVTVVPCGYQCQSPRWPSRVAVLYRHRPGDIRALSWAARLAACSDEMTMRVLTLVPDPDHLPPTAPPVTPESCAKLRAVRLDGLARALADLSSRVPSRIRVTCDVVRTWDPGLVIPAFSDLDCLVCVIDPFGLVSRGCFDGLTGSFVRRARCPVLVTSPQLKRSLVSPGSGAWSRYFT